MNEKVYMHAINNAFFDSQIRTLFKIARDGAVLSLRRQGKTESGSFSGLDYISLCDYEKRNLSPECNRYYNAYYNYIRNGISLAFDKDKLDVIVPEYRRLKEPSIYKAAEMKKLGDSDKRYTDFLDEVQVKDIITLDKLSYVTFPVNKYLGELVLTRKITKLKLLKEKVKEINLILNYFGFDSDIYDIDTRIKMDEEGINKLIYRK